MFDLKTLEEMEEAIEMMFQETDASQRTKGKHLIKKQFRLALDRIGGLERTNNRLRTELEQFPEYQQQQALKAIASYMTAFK